MLCRSPDQIECHYLVIACSLLSLLLYVSSKSLVGGCDGTKLENLVPSQPTTYHTYHTHPILAEPIEWFQNSFSVKYLSDTRAGSIASRNSHADTASLLYV